MIRMSSKIIGVISGSSAALIGGTTVTANVLLKNENGEIVVNNNPLNRDKTYHHYSIVNKVMENEKINDLITIKQKDSGIVYVVEENNFIRIMKSIVKDVLKSTSSFSKNYLNYIIKCNYKINTKSVLVDLVWYEPSVTNKFYDQFEIILQTT